MIIALFPNEKKSHSFHIRIEIRKFLEKQGITVLAEEEKTKLIGDKPLTFANPKDIDFMIPMGGDGTLLRITHQMTGQISQKCWIRVPLHYL